jgi:hypothetical protein
MDRIAAALLFTIAAYAAPQAHAATPGFPDYAPVPQLPVADDSIATEGYGQMEFVLRDKTEVKRGRTWLGYLVYAPTWGADARDAFAGIVADIQKAGWEVMLRDEPRIPPLATLRYKRGGHELWASVEIYDEARVALLEPGMPSAKLELDAPLSGIAGIEDDADFPFLKRFPGSKLLRTTRDDRAVAIETSAGAPLPNITVVKSYEVPRGTGKLEVIAVYRDALKQAGWDIVEEDTSIVTDHPSLTARYARDGEDLWAYIHARGQVIVAVSSPR